MTISIWRYSHLILAVSSFLLLTLASLTGIILSLEPVTQKVQPYRSAGFNQITLSQALPLLRKNYPGISELTVDANQFVQIKGTDADGKNLAAYVDLQTGKTIGVPHQQTEFFQWVTSLHRSLFLHETGRFLIGLHAFLLLLITVSGITLIIQRQRGWKRFFTKITRDSFAQYYHVMLGRWSLIPILIIALSGTYLSIVRFNLVDTKKQSAKIDYDTIKSTPVKNSTDFEIFKNTNLSEVESVEFPFSADVEDYYTLKLTDREVAVNQLTGDMLSEAIYPKAVLLTSLSINLHTGRASALWAIVLAVASGNILFFIYSGFAMTIKRRSGRTKNKYKAADSRFIILVGSEGGSTFHFAQAIHQQLLKAGERSYLTELNQYTLFPKAEYLLILTATYGLGEAPTNAVKFAKLVQQQPQQQPVQYAVAGFGSTAYPEFCKFAFEIHHLLSQQTWATALADIHTVNDKSPADFSLWAETLSQHQGIPLLSTAPLSAPMPKNQMQALTVSKNIPASGNQSTFMLNLQSKRRLKVTSGDLLAIYPANDHRERFYSIGVVEKEIQLCVRYHEQGLGSGFLKRLQSGEKINARIIKNPHFHFPKDAPEVVMIANGTGIAPFLGMISQNKKQIPIHLYCGFREQSSYQNYQPQITAGQQTQRIKNVYPAFSREGNKQYITDLIAENTALILNTLQKGGVIMICGSLAMEKDVTTLLDNVLQTKLGNSISVYQSRNQIRTDCY